MTKDTILNFAKMFIEETGKVDVKITDYFFKEFKLRNNVKYRNLSGESKSAVTDGIVDFFEEFDIIKTSFDDLDIFNLDETGVFFKNFGRQSYILQGYDDKKKC